MAAVPWQMWKLHHVQLCDLAALHLCRLLGPAPSRVLQLGMLQGCALCLSTQRERGLGEKQAGDCLQEKPDVSVRLGMVGIVSDRGRSGFLAHGVSLGWGRACSQPGVLIRRFSQGKRLG